MPEAFSMNSTDEGARASTSPAAIFAAWRVLWISTKALKASTSSALVTRSAGV